jgi:hypothetical protein
VETGIASNKIMTAKLLASSLKSSSTPLWMSALRGAASFSYTEFYPTSNLA